MNKIILELDIQDLPVLSVSENSTLDINLGGIDYQVKLHSIESKPKHSATTSSWHPVSYHNFILEHETVITFKGYAIDKKAKELSEAREDVRKKQQEFKDAQRKLSELMGNTN